MKDKRKEKIKKITKNNTKIGAFFVLSSRAMPLVVVVVVVVVCVTRLIELGKMICF